MEKYLSFSVNGETCDGGEEGLINRCINMKLEGASVEGVENTAGSPVFTTTIELVSIKVNVGGMSTTIDNVPDLEEDFKLRVVRALIPRIPIETIVTL